MIGSEVDKFVGNADVTEANLARLERRIHKRSTRPTDDDKSSVSNVSAYSMRDKPPPTPTLAQTMPSIKEGEQHFENFEWSKLDEYASYLHEQDAMRQKSGVLAMQQKLRLDLDRQVADQRMKKQRQREEEQKYYMNQLVEIEQWKEMERAKAEELKEKAHKEKRDRDEQLQYERMLKDEETQRKKDEEAQLVEKIAREMELEKERMEMRRQQQKEAMKKVFAENLEENKMKEELDAEAMKEYNRILDQQEEMRAQELQARMDKQKALMEKMKENVQKQQKAKGDEDARRAAKQRRRPTP